MMWSMMSNSCAVQHGLVIEASNIRKEDASKYNLDGDKVIVTRVRYTYAGPYTQEFYDVDALYHDGKWYEIRDGRPEPSKLDFGNLHEVIKDV